MSDTKNKSQKSHLRLCEDAETLAAHIKSLVTQNGEKVTLQMVAECILALASNQATESVELTFPDSASIIINLGDLERDNAKSSQHPQAVVDTPEPSDGVKH